MKKKDNTISIEAPAAENPVTKEGLESFESYNNKIHNIGRVSVLVCLTLIILAPILYFASAKVSPDWKKIVECIPFMLGYLAIGIIEAFSYAPLLGTGGQYLSFITGNISNLKLPCAINSQSIAKTKQGSEEQEIVTTISIAVSSIVTTIIIIIGLIPLVLFQEKIVEVLKPVSPYVIPAIFGGLTIILAARYFKIAAIPFACCIVICVVANLIGKGSMFSQSTMVIIGMVVSGISTFILYKKGFLLSKAERNALKAAKDSGTAVEEVENAEGQANETDAESAKDITDDILPKD